VEGLGAGYDRDYSLARLYDDISDTEEGGISDVMRQKRKEVIR
jgi:hypothetical protein